MKIPYITRCLRSLNIMTSILLVLAIMVMSAAGAFMIRMQKGPIDLSFAKAKIEQALSDPERGVELKIGSAKLVWPKVTAPLLIDLQDIHILDRNYSALTIENAALGLSHLNLLRGKIVPSVIIMDSPVLNLTQVNDEYRFFWDDDTVKNEVKIVSDDTAVTPQKVRKSLRDFLYDITNSEDNAIDSLSALKRFKINKAVIKQQNKQAEQVDLDYIALVDLDLNKTDLGLLGDLFIFLPRPDKEKNNVTLRSEVLYRHDQKDLTVTANVKDINPKDFIPYFPDYKEILSQDIVLNGAVQAAFDNKLKLQSAHLNLSVPEGRVSIPDIYQEPVSVKDVIFNAKINPQDNVFNLEKLDATIGNIPLQITAKGTMDQGYLTAPIKINITEMAMNDLPALVPPEVAKSSAGEWLTRKLSNGVLRNVNIETLLSFNLEDTSQVDLTNTKANFEGEGLTVKYSDTLMPVENASAVGSYENDTLSITSNKGSIGDLQGRDVDLKITNVGVKGGGFANLTLKAQGPFKTALQYASADPILIQEKLGFDVNTVQGQIDVAMELSFPTVKNLPKEEVEVQIKGTLSNLLLPNIVRGLPLSGGPYDISYGDGAIKLNGNGKLAGRNVKVDWMEYFDPTGKEFQTRVKAEVIADAGLRQSFNIGLEDYIEGVMGVSAVYTDFGEKAVIDIAADLTPATLRIDPFDYLKKPNQKSSVTMKAHMKGDDLQEVSQLHLTAPDLEFKKGRLIFKVNAKGETDIRQGNVPDIRLGKSNVSADFEVNKEGVLKIIATGNVVDIAPFINSDKKPKKNKAANDNQPLRISVTADKLLGDKGLEIGKSKIYIETNKASDITRIEMDSKIGQGDMYLRFKPEEETGKRTFRLESNDAGYTLKAFGLYENMMGGKLLIYGEPVHGDLTGDLFGAAKVENFRIKKAPALAKLLSVMSLQGVQNILGEQGLSFEKLESNFEWKFKDQANLLVMKEGRTSGSSLGLTFEGLVNQGANTVDINGTVIPLSGVNKAIGDIPLIGDILTGGDALIAATYSMKGPAKDPKILVNPLSVLAPGFLRKILFEGSVDQKVKKQESAQ